tara:strand:+ start:1523 stop:3157 length:1635 start_codon:yes stop_codon:yes gene_type:complete
MWIAIVIVFILVVLGGAWYYFSRTPNVEQPVYDLPVYNPNPYIPPVDDKSADEVPVNDTTYSNIDYDPNFGNPNVEQVNKDGRWLQTPLTLEGTAQSKNLMYNIPFTCPKYYHVTPNELTCSYNIGGVKDEICADGWKMENGKCTLYSPTPLTLDGKTFSCAGGFKPRFDGKYAPACVSALCNWDGSKYDKCYEKCPPGWTLHGQQCKYSGLPLEKDIDGHRFKCDPDGLVYDYNGKRLCVTSSSIDQILREPDTIPTKGFCPDGWKKEGDSCVWTDLPSSAVLNGETINCPSGYYFFGDRLRANGEYGVGSCAKWYDKSVKMCPENWTLNQYKQCVYSPKLDFTTVGGTKFECPANYAIKHDFNGVVCERDGDKKCPSNWKMGSKGCSVVTPTPIPPSPVYNKQGGTLLTDFTNKRGAYIDGANFDCYSLGKYLIGSPDTKYMCGTKDGGSLVCPKGFTKLYGDPKCTRLVDGLINPVGPITVNDNIKNIMIYSSNFNCGAQNKFVEWNGPGTHPVCTVRNAGASNRSCPAGWKNITGNCFNM